MTALTLGIDPGKHGALAFLDPTGRLVHVEDMAALTGSGLGAWLVDLLDDLRPDTVAHAWVEDVGPMPAQGVRSVWTFAEGHGVLLGALGALRVPVSLVRPNQWKKAMGLSSVKASSRDLAARTWPDRAAEFARVKDDGRAEAALLASYGQGAPDPWDGAA